MSELKFIFTGTPGAGKTTAIAAISDIPPVITDTRTTDDLADTKDATTVAMDFGEFTLDSGETIRLYGTPGQKRFDFMWKILTQGGLGLIILVDNTRPDPLRDLDIYLDNFAEFIEETGAVIGVTRMDLDDRTSLDHYYDHLYGKNIHLPLFETDVRKKDDVLILLDSLMTCLEYS